MNSCNLLTIGSLFYSILLMIVFFTKRRLSSIENRVYGALIISNFIGVVIAIACYITVSNYETLAVLNYIVSRLYLIYLVFFIFVFFYYLITILYQNKKVVNYSLNFLIMAFLIISLVIFGLPLYYHNTDGAVYSYGPAANLVYVIATICMVTWSLLLIKNYKSIKNKKFLPIILFIIGAMVVTIVQKLNPSLLLMTSMETFVTVIMYFTIENPDLKMLESYHDAKQYAEDLNIEKQMFIYNISQDMKIPLIKTSKYCEDLLYSDDLNTYKNGIRSIKSECNSMIQKINSIYDIDIDDIKNIDTDNTKYNLSNLLKLVTSNVKKDIEESNKKIQFITSIDDTLPKELIGDITRLKEVLNKLFKLSIKDTKEGFIEFKVQGLVKGSICRLMISLEDSGKGIETEKLEEMLSKDAKENDLGTAKKIINILGGNLIVSSNVGVGTKVNIVLDQEIPVSNKKDLDKYDDSYFDKKNILVLGGSADERKIFMREIDEYNGVMETAESINEVIESIKKHKRYYAIIIDGDIKYHTIKEVVEKLKGIKGFNSNIIVFSKEKEMKSSKNRAIIGIQGYIARPLVEGSVLDTLKNLDK